MTSLREMVGAALVCCLATAAGTIGGCAGDRATALPRDFAASSAAAAPAALARGHATRTVADWNAIALRTTAAATPINPPRETRSMAIVSAAVFDAVNSIDVGSEPFIARLPARHGASLGAAVATATYRALRELYPSAAPALAATYDSAMALLPPGASTDAGVAAGAEAAAAVLAARGADHAGDAVSFVAQGGAGFWVPTPPAFAAALAPGWGLVTPFAIDAGAQFRPAPPPAVGSEAYVRDLSEIIVVGAATSAARTAAQTETARFWVATAPQLWNQLAHQLVVSRGLKPLEAARAFLLLNVAGADAIIAAWDAKYAFQQWRPITAIRQAAAASSPPAGATTDWTPLVTTPPFPDYPAGHTSYAGAAETVLGALFGERPGHLAITSANAGGATHHYQSFHDVSDEVVNARVWAGVHWRTSAVTGRELGRQVGELVLRRVPPAR